MPITSAARRASLLSSMVQQPRAPERYDAGLRDSARWIPVTSWPASAARAAATAESTPPDIAARTFMRSPPRGPRALDDGPDGLDDGVDVGLGRRVAEREAQRVARRLVGAAHGQQDVRGLRDPGRAGRARGALDPAGVEQHQQRVALAVGEAEVGVSGEPVDAQGVERRAVQVGVRHRLDDAAHQVVTQRADPGRLLGLVLDRQLDGGGEAGDRGGVDGAAADVALLAPTVHQRGDVDLAAYDERADAVRAADLVAGQRERVDPAGTEVDRDRADGLD